MKKWYQGIVLHMLVMTLVNAWLLYRRDCQSQMPDIAHLTLLDFKSKSGLMLVHRE